MKKNGTLTLEIFSDFTCPWCYLSTGHIEKLRQEHDFSVRWIAFPLHPEIPEEGITLEQLFSGCDIDIPEYQERMIRIAAEHGLPFGRREKSFNSRRAQELKKWAESRNRGEQFHAAVFKAYFVHGLNISDLGVLSDIAESIGLDPAEARDVAAHKYFRKAVDSDWAYCRSCGIAAVPTFAAAGQRLVGAQSYAALKKLVTSSASEV